jgi:hypothetical protein
MRGVVVVVRTNVEERLGKGTEGQRSVPGLLTPKGHFEQAGQIIGQIDGMGVVGQGVIAKIIGKLRN